VGRFLIEVPHEDTAAACARAAELLLRTGSHFLTRAEYGCRDGVHKAWIIVEVDSKDEARNVVPAELRSVASIVGLNYFTMAMVDELKRRHNG
jgi:hypothetical protein